MRITTRAIYQMTPDGGLILISSEGFDYDGPLELAGRSQSNQAFQQSSGQSAEDQANAQSSLAAANKSLDKYSSNLDRFMKFGRDTYSPEGEFMRDQNTIANTTAAASNKATNADLALNAMRTGANTSGYADTVAEDRRQASRDLTSQLAGADATRLQNLTNVNQFGVQASGLPAQVQASLYGTSTSGATGQGGNAANAARQPGFWDTFAPALAGAAGNVGAGFAKGCWIAAVVFGGWDDPRTQLVRRWLHQQFALRTLGRIVVGLYLKHGESIARHLENNPRLQPPFRWLFNQALRQAQEWEISLRPTAHWQHVGPDRFVAQ